MRYTVGRDPRHPLVMNLPDAHLELKPDVYDLTASWDASTVGPETPLLEPRYGSVASPMVTVKIIP